MEDDRDFTSYVAARWTPLVHCLVALGGPPDRAHRVTERALSSCHDDWEARDEWGDVDVHVVGELLDHWDRDRDAWWEESVPSVDDETLVEAGWPPFEAELDRMSVPDRRALVLCAVAGLSEEQAQALTGVDGPRPDAPPADDLRMALELVPVQPPRVESMIAASQTRRRRRRGASIAGVVALLAAAGVVTALVLRHSDPPAAEPGTTFAPVRSLPYNNPSPVAWYAAGTLYLPHSQVPLRDVVDFAQWDDGAVYLDVRGNLVTVTRDGERERIATPGPGSTFVVSDVADAVAWVEFGGPELVVYDLETGERRVERRLESVGARLVSVEDRLALLTVDDDVLAVDLSDGSIEPTVDRRLPGELDRHGRYVLTREGGGGPAARIRLIDTTTSRPLSLPIVETRDVAAARFGPDGSVVLLFDPQEGSVTVVRVCEPPYDYCVPVEWFPAGGARPLLAQ
jgi:hypothetical protein